ncbi:MAG: hypothetical protein JNM66_22915 [Bryobacterales bacterium]|nr:hypothetical protein [Bryobacterales bacterium]
MSCFRRGITSLPVHVAMIASLYGQAAPQTPAPTKPVLTGSPNVSTDLKRRAYVKPISVGMTLSVLGQVPMVPKDYGEERSGYLETATTGVGGYRIGWGGNVQVRLPSKFAVVGSVLLHKSAHGSTIDTYVGTDNPNTPLDDRIHTTFEESSIVNYWDYTVMLRRYTKDHFAAGHRAFYGGGVNFRDIRKIRTERETTLGADTVPDTKPIVPTRDMGIGITGAVGAQFTDDFGVKLVPEFRFTRWMQPNFDTKSQLSRKNQFEAVVSITF